MLELFPPTKSHRKTSETAQDCAFHERAKNRTSSKEVKIFNFWPQTASQVETEVIHYIKIEGADFFCVFWP